MFNNHRGNEILTTSATGIPDFAAPTPGRRGAAGGSRQVPSLYYVATRDSKTGTVYLNLVNQLGSPQTVHIDLKGAASVDPDGQSIIMKADSPEDTNSIAEPTKIVPVTAKATGFSSSFDRTLAPYSINIFEIGTK
jgi:alpha-N-arabinofuranosidase